jgi:hypothetical protein
MKFRMKTLCMAVGAACGAAAAAPALALAPSAFNPATTAQVYISGASAQSNGLIATMARLCVPGTMDRYVYGALQFAYFCTTNATLIPGITKTQLIVYKSDDKGSGNGVLPLLGTGTPLPFLNMAAINTTGACSTTSGVASVTLSGDALGVPSYTLRTCDATVTGVTTTVVRPDAGLSDVEPPFFTTKSTSSINSVSANSVTFGFIVSKNLYRALQRAQSLDFSTTSLDSTVSTTVTGIAVPIQDNEHNMPSLTRDTVASLFAGTYGTWDNLVAAVGTSAAALTTFSGNDNAADTAHPAPTDTNVYLARRVPSSGSQKATELFLFGGTGGGFDDGLGLGNAYPATCDAAAVTMLASPSDPNADPEGICTTPAGQTVFEGSGTANVRNCVTNHYAGNRWAIGLVSTESPFAPGNNWRFIKVDGQSPSLLNVSKNNYKHWVSQSANKPPYFGTLGADKTSVVNKVFASLGSQTVIRAINATIAQVWGAGSLFSLLENGAVPSAPPLTQAKIQVNPGLPLTRAPLGATDNCKLPVYLSPNQIN